MIDPFTSYVPNASRPSILAHLLARPAANDHNVKHLTTTKRSSENKGRGSECGNGFGTATSDCPRQGARWGLANTWQTSPGSGPPAAGPPYPFPVEFFFEYNSRPRGTEPYEHFTCFTIRIPYFLSNKQFSALPPIVCPSVSEHVSFSSLARFLFVRSRAAAITALLAL